MKSVLTLSLITLLCTCGRAQSTPPGPLSRGETSVAFIKSKATGFLIDSISIRTSLDPRPYGFAFPDDTLLLDIAIFRPVGELTLETFVRGKSFGRQSCWVDPPSADVHLSVNAGRGIIDSVGLSPMDNWYRREMSKIKRAPSIDYAKEMLSLAIYNSSESLMTVPFLELYANLPNLTRLDVDRFNDLLFPIPKQVRLHPRFRPLAAKIKVMRRFNGNLSRYELVNTKGETERVITPETDYWVLNIYDATTTKAREDHLLIRRAIELDSLFDGVPVISVGSKASEEAWLSYQNTNNFPWPHYRERPTKKAGLVEKAGLYPGATYLLLNMQDRVEGVYDNIYSLEAAILYRKRVNKP